MSFFEPLIGQPRAIELLTQAVTRQRIAPAYLFAGSNGVGRSLAALGFVTYLFSQEEMGEAELQVLRQRVWQRNHPDLLWVEPSYLHQGKRLSVAEAIAAAVKRKTPPTIRLEQVREVSQFLARSPLEANRSVVVIEQAEAMAEAPASALLKTLEEPGQATLILIAASAESLLPTLVSRCQRIPFGRLSLGEMTTVLQRAGHPEILAKPEILQLAQGSPGAAIGHWEKFQEISPELLNQVSQPVRSHRAALSLARQIQQSLELDSQLWLIDFLQHHYWQTMTMPPQTPSASLVRPLQLLEKARDYLLKNVNPRLVWEVTLIQMVE